MGYRPSLSGQGHKTHTWLLLRRKIVYFPRQWAIIISMVSLHYRMHEGLSAIVKGSCLLVRGD